MSGIFAVVRDSWNMTEFLSIRICKKVSNIGSSDLIWPKEGVL